VNRSGAVLADDSSDVRRRFFTSPARPGTGEAAYSVFHDVNGSGSILADDFAEVKWRFFNYLPPIGSLRAPAAPPPDSSISRELFGTRPVIG
jgi:hypothetical protein